MSAFKEVITASGRPSWALSSLNGPHTYVCFPPILLKKALFGPAGSRPRDRGRWRLPPRRSASGRWRW
jgi:hypothetical protein